MMHMWKDHDRQWKVISLPTSINDNIAAEGNVVLTEVTLS